MEGKTVLSVLVIEGKAVLSVPAVETVLCIFQQQEMKYLSCPDCRTGDENDPFAKAKTRS